MEYLRFSGMLMFIVFAIFYLDLMKDDAVLLEVIALMSSYPPVNIALGLVCKIFFSKSS